MKRFDIVENRSWVSVLILDGVLVFNARTLEAVSEVLVSQSVSHVTSGEQRFCTRVSSLIIALMILTYIFLLDAVMSLETFTIRSFLSWCWSSSSLKTSNIAINGEAEGSLVAALVISFTTPSWLRFADDIPEGLMESSSSHGQNYNLMS